MNDSGKRQEFATGSVRDTVEGKPTLELVSPFFLDRLGSWLERGSRKYSSRNWERGQPFQRVMGSLLRHANAFQKGDTSEDNLAAIACNAMFLIHFEEMIKRGVLPKELNDMPDYQPKQEGQPCSPSK